MSLEQMKPTERYHSGVIIRRKGCTDRLLSNEYGLGKEDDGRSTIGTIDDDECHHKLKAKYISNQDASASKPWG